MLSVLDVSAQLALPEWVRGQSLAMFVTVFFGAATLGSAFGEDSLPRSQAFRSLLSLRWGCGLIAIPLTGRWNFRLAGKLTFRRRCIGPHRLRRSTSNMSGGQYW